MARTAAETPGARLPIVKERRYVMSGAVRPLLFWIGREDIGLARIVWRRGDDGSRGYELLVGTDPARAPARMNRWGFISAEASGSDGSVLALMTGSQQTTFDDEAAAARARGGDFQAFLSRVRGGTAEWRLSRVRTAEAITVHDLGRAVECVQQGTSTPAQQRTVSAATRAGFLLAVSDLLDAALRGPARPGLDAARVRYVFGDQLYELQVRNADRQSLMVNGRRVPVLKTSFETRTLSTGERSQFVVTAGTSGELSGVPVEIEWQPRWWLRVRLALVE
jgi:hypothetical protein